MKTHFLIFTVLIHAVLLDSGMALHKHARKDNILLARAHHKHHSNQVKLDPKYIYPAVYYIQNADNGLVVGINGASTGDNVALVSWGYFNTTNEQFWIRQIDDDYATVTAIHSNKVLTQNGDAIIQTPLAGNSGNPNQQWKFVYNEDKGTYRIVSKTSNAAWTLPAQKGTNILLRTPDTSNAQQFFVKPIGDYAAVQGGNYRIVPILTPSATMDLSGGGGNNGAGFITYNPHGGDNQNFIIEQLDENYYVMTVVHSRMGVSGNNANGGAVFQSPQQGNDNQQWALTSVSNGVWKLKHKGTGGIMMAPANVGSQVTLTNNDPKTDATLFKFVKTYAAVADGTYMFLIPYYNQVFDVAGASGGDNANVIMWPSHGGANQRWVVTRKEDVYYSICAQHSGKCFTIYQDSKEVGYPIVQYPYQGTANQLWEFLDYGAGQYKIRAKSTGQFVNAPGGQGGAVIQRPVRALGYDQQIKLNKY